jgi:hypothetical protein
MTLLKKLMWKYYSCAHGLFFIFRQASLQYLTSSQTVSHFFRQEKGRLHTKQSLLGRSLFLICRIIFYCFFSPNGTR